MSVELTSDQSTVSQRDARELLDWLGALCSQVKRARQASWWPLGVAGVVVMAGCWLYLPPSHVTQPFTQAGLTNGPSGALLNGAPLTHPAVAAAYWLAAVPGWYMASAYYYLRRAKATGYRVPALWWAIVGVCIFAVLVVSSSVATSAVRGWLPWLATSDLAGRGLGPVLLIVLALPLLAWAERSIALTAVWAVLVGAVLLADLYDLSNLLGAAGPSFGNAVNVAFVGTCLSLAGAVLWWAQRVPRILRPGVAP